VKYRKPDLLFILVIALSIGVMITSYGMPWLLNIDAQAKANSLAISSIETRR